MPKPVIPIKEPYTPEFLPEAAAMVERFLSLNPKSKVFEFGSGFSTVWFAQHAGKVITVEHDEEWAEETIRAVKAAKKSRVVTVLQVEEKDIPAAIDGRGQFDVILVDCIDWERVESAKRAISHLAPGGLFILDDSHWPLLAEARQLLEATGWEKHRFHGKHTRKNGLVKPHETTIYTKPTDGEVLDGGSVFRVMAGSGHCGTMLLASILDSLPGQNWTNEARTSLTGLSWEIADAYLPDARIFDSYWRSIRGRLLKHGIVGDAVSWPPELLPQVNKIIPIERVIYITRDKDKQLNSIMTNSPVWSKTPYPSAANERLKMYSRISGLPLGVELLVQANDFMPEWLRSKGLTVDVYSLEELTTNIDRLRELAPLPDSELISWQQQNINQKVFV